jgi:YVTN family beta-propeller protein
MSFIKRYLRRVSYFCVLLLLPVTLAASTERLYVVNDAGTTITEIDPATNKVVRTIGDVEVPRGIHASPDGRRLYVTNGVDHVLDVLDQKTLARIKRIPLDGEADDVKLTPDGKRVLITIHAFPGAPGALDIVDTTSLEKVKTIVTKSWLHDMGVTADGKYAVAGSPGGDMKTAVVTVFDLKKEEIAWEVQLDRGVTPLAIESNPDGSARRLFLTLEKFNGFSVVDFESHKETARIELPKEPSGYGTGTAQSHGIAIAPDGKSVWVNCEPCNSVYAYSLPDLKLIGHVEMPALRMPGKTPTGMPYWVIFAPSGKTVYVAVAVLRQVVAIDPATMKIVATIPVGEVVDRMSVDVLP